ncbi:MAG: glycosyltransferase family 2 protein [Bacteroidales bacterium]|nr:glycosyltransferase family 2 protein [Bacteroidales bacterium]
MKIIEKVGLIVPTFNGGDIWRSWIDAFNRQEERPSDLLVIDSSSDDNTADISRANGFKVLTIQREEFDHGGTRQLGVDILDEDDIILFMTQDAILVERDAIKNLVKAFDNPMVSAAYGRQKPRLKANAIESHARYFNYPPASLIKSKKDIMNLGIKTVFISNSFSAYRRKSLIEIGGFPSNNIFAEDMYVAAKMVLSGASVAYCAEASVFHSHKYSLIEEFRRHFDNGAFHAREPWIQENFGGAGGEGVRYVISELQFLGLKNWHIIPLSAINNIFKLIGYKAGKNERYIPKIFKKKLSMNTSFWDKDYLE